MTRSSRSSRRKHTVHWFRKGLRLSDNPALLRGIRRSETFRCIFILDPWFAGSSNVGTNKWRFLLECLEDLDTSLRRLNSRLFVIRGQPADVLPSLFKEWGTTYFTFEEDPEPFGRVRDQNTIAMCREMGISVTHEHSHTLYNLDKIIEANAGRPPLTYKQFQRIIEGMELPPKPVPTLTMQMLGSSVTPLQDDHDEKFAVPSLEELGFDCESLKPPVWHGGEMEALSRLERHLERKAWVASFGLPKMTPQSLLASQTGLSPYLRFGCLSTRLFYHALSDLYRKIKRGDPPLSLHGQLLWREFFYCAATKNPNFDKMAGNPICVQIPWDNNNDALAKWANANTGFPWIDAIMTQLREEGWIHHLARHAVACFLTRGDLWVSWEEGLKVFDELLLDADWSVNAGTWLWLSCSSFFQQFFHCYCPVRFGRKADANGDFIRRYLPILKNFPTRYIHEPWTAPEAVQKSAKCIIGTHYPKPMCNHTYVSKVNMERMKQVYAQLSHYRKTGQTGPGIPQDLLAQMKKVPRIPSPGGGLMGPPNPPDTRGSIVQLAVDSTWNKNKHPSGGPQPQDNENLQQMRYLPNYQIQNLAHLGLGSPPPVSRQPNRAYNHQNLANAPGYQVAPYEGALVEFSQAQYQTPNSQPPTNSPYYPSSYSSPADTINSITSSLPLILGDLILPPPEPSSGARSTVVDACSTHSNMGSSSATIPGSLSGSTENLDSAGQGGPGGQGMLGQGQPDHLQGQGQARGRGQYDMEEQGQPVRMDSYDSTTPTQYDTALAEAYFDLAQMEEQDARK